MTESSRFTHEYQDLGNGLWTTPRQPNKESLEWVLDLLEYTRTISQRENKSFHRALLGVYSYVYRRLVNDYD